MILTEKIGKLFDRVRGRKRAYQLFWSSPAGQEVLMDLMRFCRATTSCYDPDPRIHAALEGRREVYLRIQQHLNIPSEKLFQFYYGRAISTETDDV